MKNKLSMKQILVTLFDACLCIKHVECNVFQNSNADIKNGYLCHEDEYVSHETTSVPGVGRRRIKVLITRKQLDRLLEKQVSLEQLVFVNQRMFVTSFNENKWKPRLECIHETPEL
ncbi:unnamed protein product [Eruca vesicaria subsp. sativa]|uniref:Uncharacterized protein n=1 Tax=Eruca vesicaria subsp. sativa TaxID=29727 RepID=A0ABC8L0U6_ERUVS|nr:unnamed protein product [Eruca vesicaria subsp. sativa]